MVTEESMAGVTERVAVVEARVQEQAVRIDDVRDAVTSLERSMNDRFVSFEGRVDRRFESIESRLDGIDNKMSRQFTWLVGLYVTGLIAFVAAYVAR
jgi:hypothetical protein